MDLIWVISAINFLEFLFLAFQAQILGYLHFFAFSIAQIDFGNDRLSKSQAGMFLQRFLHHHLAHIEAIDNLYAWCAWFSPLNLQWNILLFWIDYCQGGLCMHMDNISYHQLWYQLKFFVIDFFIAACSLVDFLGTHSLFYIISLDE